MKKVWGFLLETFFITVLAILLFLWVEGFITLDTVWQLFR